MIKDGVALTGRIGRPSSSIQAFPTGSPTCSTPRFSPPASWCLRSARATCWRNAIDQRAHHGADGGRAAGGARTAAALPWRSAWAQYAGLSADQDRSHGGALGRRRPRRFSPLRLARREGRAESVRDLDPARRLAHPHAPAQWTFSGTEGRAAAGPAAGEDRILRVPHHARARLPHDRTRARRRVAAVARRLFETRWYLRWWRRPGGSASSRSPPAGS